MLSALQWIVRPRSVEAEASPRFNVAAPVIADYHVPVIAEVGACPGRYGVIAFAKPRVVITRDGKMHEKAPLVACR